MIWLGTVLFILACVKVFGNPEFSVHLIIAHFQEDVAWLKDVHGIKKENIFLYQKHSPNGERYIKNTGNECHAYVRHIVDHYDKLPDYAIFLHDKPVKHCPNYLDYLNHAPIYESKKDFENGKPRPLVFITDLYQNHSLMTLNTHIPDIHTYYKKWLGKPIASYGTSIWSNGQFQVAKERILARPLGFWQEVLLELTSSDKMHGERHGVYICGYLEQMWHELLGNPPVTQIISRAYINGEEKQMCNKVV